MEGRLLQQTICRKFCRYYKPSKEEGLACLGYLVIESLSNSGREMRFPASCGKPGASAERILLDRVCARCPFYEDGCDFVSGAPDSSPCGGFIVLGHMHEAGDLSVHDMEVAIGLMNQNTA